MSGPRVGGVCSVYGVRARVDGSVGHRSLVGGARTAVVIPPVHPAAAPVHHHDNRYPLLPWQPRHLRGVCESRHHDDGDRGYLSSQKPVTL